MDKKAQDLTVVLFGNSSAVGDENALLGKPTADNPDFSMIVPVPQKISGRSLSIISLFDLQDRDRYQDSVDHTIARLVTENKIHAFIFVLQLGKLTDTDKVGLEWLQSKFGEGVLQFVMILFTYEREEDFDTIIDDLKKNPVLVELLRKCGDRYHTCSKNMNNQSEKRKLLELIDDMVSENHHSCYTAELYNSASDRKGLQDVKSQQSLSEKLNLVLCGSDGAVKSSISDLILGQREPSPGSSSVCVGREGAVCGRLVTLVEMPALYNTQLSEEEVIQETLRCVSLCDPGVHAFLLIMSEGRLTDKDKGEMKKIRRLFGSRFNNHLMFIINADSQQEAGKLDDAIKSFTETYSRQICILDSNKVVLLEQAEQLVIQNSGGCYTTAMYLGAQVETQMKYKSKIEELQNTISFLRGELKNRAQESSPGTGDLRIVLLGKTGVGKSAAGNTILGRKQTFREVFSSRSVTSVCQKESAEVRGRQISVIDTPGLFDTGVSNEEIMKEIAKCITMAAPGPHVFLLVLALGRFTQEEEEAVKMIQDLFGEESRRYTMVLFTRGDDLEKMEMSIEDFIKDSERSLQNMIHQCGNRYHVFNNSFNDHSQVTALLEKIDSMVAVNGGSCYTNEMFQQLEEALKEEQERILKEKEEEIEREKEELKMKHEAEIAKLKCVMEEEIRSLAKERSQKEAFEKQIMKDLEIQKEKYEREKESIRQLAEKEAREQAEKEFCAELEKVVAKAKEDGYEKGKSDFRSNLSYASWLAHYGSVSIPFGGIVAGTVGGLLGGIVDSLLLIKNRVPSFKSLGHNKKNE